MTNKYTLKDPYKWNIERDYSDSRNMVLSVEHDTFSREYVFVEYTIRFPEPQDAQAEIIKAMDKIKQDNPELFADYVNTADAFSDALKKIETLNDIQLSEILWRSATTSPDLD